jgi:hypothetical protein
MSFPFDGHETIKIVQGNTVNANKTGNASGWQSVVFGALFAADTNFAAVTWTVQDSLDGTTWATASADAVVYRAPTTGASKSHQVGYVGNAPYARATIAGGTSPAYVSILGKPVSAPIFHETIRGLEDGVMVE